jgi:hypothetical protein
MGNHASEFDPEMQKQMMRFMDRERSAIADQFRDRIAEQLGPTRKFPRGKLTAHDEGEIKIGIAADVKNQTVIIDFGGQVTWIGFDFDQAMALSDSIRDRANELRGIKS